MFLHTGKNIPAREMLTKKIRAAQKVPSPPPPNNSSYGPSLSLG